jgi:formate dehydrogenase iron-sulfur subunit
VELPLLQRAQSGDEAFVLTTADTLASELGSYCGVSLDLPLPSPPGPGEQYRFHFDMTKCIGCKCCVVACNEQNGNPADILWRRVGEIEGGIYPNTLRHYLSMGCNHCLEPTCMTGCPVDAYSKDPLTGIVRHSADACIGCQYCTWNCSYGVPQYNPERGVVGKCDMCYGRLTQGQQPACAFACPEGAIRIETVRVADWRQEYSAAANSPGMPSAEDSLSTTRITLPANMPRDTRKVDLDRVRPEQPHWPLVVMTVLTQLSVGAFASIWLLELIGAHPNRSAAVIALFIASLALGASTLHLGRPIHAFRAVKMWRRSWLSREVLLFSLFAAIASAYSAALWFAVPGTAILGGLTTLLGLAGVFASAKLYLVPGRPAWNSPFTMAEFFLTTEILGSVAAVLLTNGAPLARSAVTLAGFIALALGGVKFIWLLRSETHELRGTARLLSTVLAMRLLLRFALLGAGLLLLPYADSPSMALALALLIVGGEFLGRFLFFVSVVPTNIATEYLLAEAA